MCVLEPGDERRQLVQVACEVGVHEHDDLAPSDADAATDGRALPQVPGQPDHAGVGQPVQALLRHGGRVVRAAVVDEDELVALGGITK